MAIVNISVDTITRQAVLTVDGQIIPAVACHLSKGIDFDGEPFLSLSYVLENDSGNGLIERQEFSMPREDDESVFAKKSEFIVRKIDSDDEFKALLAFGSMGSGKEVRDTVDFFNKWKKR